MALSKQEIELLKNNKKNRSINIHVDILATIMQK